MVTGSQSFGRGLVLALLFAAPAFAGARAESPPPAAQPQVRIHEAPGNLAAGQDLGCMPLAAVGNRHTPADLYPAVANCLEDDRLDEAVDLFAIAGAYGAFDRLRVADRTAHQGIKFLIARHIGRFDVDKRLRLKAEVAGVTAADSPRRGPLCAAIGRIGRPAYHPTYLIQHGMGAFLPGEGKPALVEPFDAAAAWRSVLTDYLHCP